MSVVRVVGAAIRQQQKCLIAQRGPGMSHPGKWEFPGGKLEAGESEAQALAREIAEELGLQVAVGALLGSGSALMSGRHIQLAVYAASVVSGTLALREHSRIHWVTADELMGFDWADADVPVLPTIRAWLSV
jgi:mutator protein MutT